MTQYRIDVDWEKAGALGVPISAIHNTISAAFGSAYVNDFIQGGRVKRVYVQADAPYRMLPKDLERLYVPNAKGTMTPFTSFATGHWFLGAPLLERFNSFPALNIWGEPAPGRSSGEAMQAMEEIVPKLPKGVGFDWTGLSFQERMAKSQAPLLYTFSILVIFLCLAALYESWTIPIAILLALPLGSSADCGHIPAGTAQRCLLPDRAPHRSRAHDQKRHPDRSVCQGKVEEGMGLVEATLAGAKLRLRPIVMTSLAFGFGVLPLAMATGAGAGAQMAIGTGVLGGMVTATFMAIFFIPLFFVGVCSLFGKKQGAQTAEPDSDALSPRRGSDMTRRLFIGGNDCRSASPAAP